MSAQRESWFSRWRRKATAPAQPASERGGTHDAPTATGLELDLVSRLEAIGDPGRDPFAFGQLCQEIAAAQVAAAVPRLLTLLSRPGALSVGMGGPRNEVIKALGAIGDPAAVTALAQELKSPDDLTAVLAAGALGEIGDSEAVEPLLAVLPTDSVLLRGATVRALGRLGDARALPAVRALAADPNQEVQRDVEQALRHLGSGSAEAPEPTGPSDEVSSWRVEPAGSEREALCDAGELSRASMASFEVLAIVSPAGAALDRSDTVTVRGALTCVCGFESPAEIEVGLRGFLDSASKQSLPCPQCNALTLVAGATTGEAGNARHWLLLTQQTGGAGSVVTPGSARPQLRVDQILAVSTGRRGTVDPR